MTRHKMTLLFCTLATMEAICLLWLLWNEVRADSKLMSFTFTFIAALGILAATCTAFYLLPSAKWICLAVLCSPAFVLLWNLFDNQRWAYLHDPIRKYDRAPAMRDLVKAVQRADVENVRRYASKLDRADSTPLLLAIEGRQTSIVQILIDNGAAPNAEALQRAIDLESPEILTKLFQKGATPTADLFEKAMRRERMARTFVEAGFKDASRYAPQAVREGSFATALYLLDHADHALVRIEVEKQLELCRTRAQGIPEDLKELKRRL
jgi:hypothetical protein